MKFWSAGIALTVCLLLVAVQLAEGRFGQGGRKGVDAMRPKGKSDEEVRGCRAWSVLSQLSSENV